jgi:hypothetical protein
MAAPVFNLFINAGTVIRARTAPLLAFYSFISGAANRNEPGVVGPLGDAITRQGLALGFTFDPQIGSRRPLRSDDLLQLLQLQFRLPDAHRLILGPSNAKLVWINLDENSAIRPFVDRVAH